MAKKTKARTAPKRKPSGKEARDNKPALVDLLARAGRAYGRSLQNIQVFAETYVQAKELYGSEAVKEFRSKWAFWTDSMWSHAEQIGKHNLLPQFWLASDQMIQGLLRSEKSMEKQLLLVGATKDGKIETVDDKGEIKLKSLQDLSRLDELGIVFALNSATAPDEIKKFAYQFRKDWKVKKPAKSDYEKVGDYLRINHAIKVVNKEDWLKMGQLMGWTAQ